MYMIFFYYHIIRIIQQFWVKNKLLFHLIIFCENIYWDNFSNSTECDFGQYFANFVLS